MEVLTFKQVRMCTKKNTLIYEVQVKAIKVDKVYTKTCLLTC